MRCDPWVLAAGLCGLVLVPPPASARTITFYSMGIGKTSCQKYTFASNGLNPDHFRTLLKEQRTFVSENDTYDEWIRGVISGMNYASAESGRHPVVRPSSVEAITWVRNWCASHPDETVMTAILTYVQQMWTGTTTATPTQASPQAAASQAEPQFVFVIFQKDVAAAGLASFLKTYHVAIDDGPNPDGFYKLRLAEPLPPDQLNAMLESMRSQSIVSTAVTN